ncbi:MAG: 50S ribosomal protein L1 [Deltaproteobacteria bacterium]|nr:50S ribosomal protein L1 [Deltaproteobacteria bacterium]MCB9487758.1 50S ribosomal protein L1 [Deltaproteobacteria bacterium]
MPKTGKSYRAAQAVEGYDRQERYSVEDAIAVLKKFPNAKFDETVDLALRLGVNPRHADQMVRGSTVLPHGTGKTLRVLVFAKGEKVKEAEEAGADFVGGEEFVQKILDGWMDFDKVVATPDMMGAIAKLGRTLGPRGMMPNPKLGTVTFDVADAVGAFKKGKVEFRVDKVGNLHAPIGKKSFSEDALKANLVALLDQVIRLKPASAKGAYLRTVSVSATMSPAIKIDPAAAQGAVR